MPLTDFFMVLRWWGTLFLVGAAAYPLTKRLFSRWYDAGYFFAKAVGMAAVTWIVYLLGMAHIAPFTEIVVVGSIIAVFGIGIILHQAAPEEKEKEKWHHALVTIGIEEGIFFLALLLWSWVKAHEPSIRGLEKFMDYGFMQSALRSTFFPPADMWYPPLAVNYYYFGHLVTAVLTKVSGLDLAVTFNLMLATIFALCLTMSFSIGYQLLRASQFFARRSHIFAVIGGTLTAFMVTLAGNMQTIYAFTRGYTGEDVAPFWKLAWSVGEFWEKLPEGMARYWYANATRFIPFTIHEFPSYSFVVSDIHGHVLSIPFVLLAIGLLMTIFGLVDIRKKEFDLFSLGIYGFLVGVLLMTNALDGPIYLGLFMILLTITHLPFPKGAWKQWGIETGVVLASALGASLPFLVQFKSFVNGIAVNCPLSFFANTKAGPILFEGVEKCQQSPLWMMWLLWGFFWFCGALLLASRIDKMKHLRDIRAVWNTKFTHIERILVVFYIFCFALIIFPEFFYFKDIYPQHFRSNTMFKLGYQAFIMWSIVSAYAIMHLFFGRRPGAGIMKRLWVRVVCMVLVIFQFFLTAIYPTFSVRSYFGELNNYDGLYGLTWLMREYPDDYGAIMWLKQHDPHDGSVIAEADGDSYTDYERFSVFTGIPTVVGWAVHEWLWRGSYDVVSPRREDVRKIYESEDIEETKRILDEYHVRYIVVGTIEREKFTSLAEWKFDQFARVAYQQNETVIYERIN